MASYTDQQIAFTFSMVSNAASAQGVTDFGVAIEQTFQKVTNEYAQYIGMGWEMPWLSVFTSDLDLLKPEADNSLIVVQGTGADGSPLFIVAVAGTNPHSWFGEILEDAAVKMVDFPAGGKVSRGTMTGINKLLNLKLNGQSLQEFLRANANSDATLVFTGHSLGGALSPALALSVDTSGWGKVLVYPSAGPTPGNSEFANVFSSRFPPSASGDPKSSWNCNIVNAVDVVPLAWTQLAKISGLYLPLVQPSACINEMQGFFEGRPGSSNSFADLPRVTFDNGVVPPPPPQAPLPPLTDPTLIFLSEALYQHSTAYTREIAPEIQGVFPGLTVNATMVPKISGFCTFLANHPG